MKPKKNKITQRILPTMMKPTKKASWICLNPFGKKARKKTNSYIFYYIIVKPKKENLCFKKGNLSNYITKKQFK